jgi:membrane protein DedA with SNARE-associated domain
VHELLLRYDAGIIIGVRFAYGLRILGPIVIGTTPLAAWRFMLFNALGAAIWAPLMAGAGYLFGQTLQLLLADMKQFELVALLLILAVALLTWLLHRRSRRRR